jgi:hypothetical protein
MATKRNYSKNEKNEDENVGKERAESVIRLIHV